MSMFAAMLLLVDVVLLMLSWPHSVYITWVAAVFVLLGAACNGGALCFIFEEEQRKLTWRAFRWDMLFLLNVVCLDGFIYEETAYNYFGHPDNIVKQERTFGACLEVFVAAGIFATIAKQYGASGKKMTKHGMV